MFKNLRMYLGAFLLYRGLYCGQSGRIRCDYQYLLDENLFQLVLRDVCLHTDQCIAILVVVD